MSSDHRTARLCATASILLALTTLNVEANEVADAAKREDWAAVRTLLERGATIDAALVDGSTALHWAVLFDELETARLLISAGANVAATDRAGTTPLRLATINGSATMIELLLESGVDANTPLTEHDDTPLMFAARTGKPDAIEMLLEHGADVAAAESWGGTTALMWAIAEHHEPAVTLLIERGAPVDARSNVVPQRPAGARGVEGTVPIAFDPEQAPLPYINGGFTPLHFAAREGQIGAVRALLAAGADVDAIAADGKNALGLAIYNGHYELASALIEAGADVNHADAEGFPPLFWAVDRRNMEWNPGFPWIQTADPLPLVRELLVAGADPNTFINNRPESRRNFGGSPRIKFATSLMRAAYSGDVTLVRLLLEFGADPLVKNSDNETALLAASGYGWIDGYSKGRSNAERLDTMKVLVELGDDVNWACNDGITPVMMAANFGDTDMIQFLVDQGADLSAHDLGKKNDGVFGGSIEPLMPIDYAIGVGSFRPNNAVLHMAEATELLTRLMAERGIAHTTSECTLRAFSCGSVDPQGATPSGIALARSVQIGNQVAGITGGLSVEGKTGEDK